MQRRDQIGYDRTPTRLGMPLKLKKNPSSSSDAFELTAKSTRYKYVMYTFHVIRHYAKNNALICFAVVI